MAKASDNLFPYVHLVPAAAPASPAAGAQRLYLDSGNSNKLTRKDSSGTTTVIEGGSGGSSTFIGARVYNSANIACASSADTVLTFNSERYDTDTIHDTAANTGRLTAKTAGKYHIAGSVMFAANGTGARGISIRLNGTTTVALVRVPAVGGGTDVTALTIDTVYDLALNDYVELVAYHTSGSSLNVSASGNFSPEFAMHKVG
jgi:hypothetical protein